MFAEINIRWKRQFCMLNKHELACLQGWKRFWFSSNPPLQPAQHETIQNSLVNLISIFRWVFFCRGVCKHFCRHDFSWLTNYEISAGNSSSSSCFSFILSLFHQRKSLIASSQSGRLKKLSNFPFVLNEPIFLLVFWAQISLLALSRETSFSSRKSTNMKII